jgi:hypothetical protein
LPSLYSAIEADVFTRLFLALAGPAAVSERRDIEASRFGLAYSTMRVKIVPIGLDA